EFVNKEKIDRSKRLDMLRSAIAQYDNLLRSKRQALRTLAEAAGTNDAANLALKQKTGLDQLSAVQKELVQINSGRRKTRLEIQAREGSEKGRMVPEQTINQMIEADASVKKLGAKIQSMEEAVENAKKAFGNEAEVVKAYERDLAGTRKDLERLKEK